MIISSLIGGVMIGLSASLLMFANGRVAGISGIFAGVVLKAQYDWLWRAVFVLGLLVGGGIIAATQPELTAYTLDRSPYALIVAGLLVGFGSRLGSGCTSGHGVCGLSRGSRRSLVGVVTFMIAGVLTVALVRFSFGGSL